MRETATSVYDWRQVVGIVCLGIVKEAIPEEGTFKQR